MTQINLSQQDREFFSLVSKAAFANPFSSERDRLDSAIAQAADTLPNTVEAINKVRSRIATLDNGKLKKLHEFSPADRGIIEHVLLFDIFHRFSDAFDELIRAQVSHSGDNLPVPFAMEILKQLASRGFDDATSAKYLSLFFQLRRAYYFIAHGLIGTSDSMRKLRMELWNNIFTHDIIHYERLLWNKMEDFSTLLVGPTGCGKGAAAAAIGQSGFLPFDVKKQCFAQSFTSTFISVNLSEYPESLLESELFGHTKGAFTGAVTSHDGLFALCSSHGSIFLDEVGEISIPTQIKLLQVLQERIFCQVGSHEKQRFGGRVIAATNKSLDLLRAQGKFRDDFYYRLCTDCIEVPSLYKRVQENPRELAQLVSHSVAQITGQSSDELVQSVLEIIKTRLGPDYHWPGNVRELAQCVRRVIIKRDYQGQTRPDHDTLKTNLESHLMTGTLTASELLALYCKSLYKNYGTYEEVSRRTDLDRRTVKKYIEIE